MTPPSPRRPGALHALRHRPIATIVVTQFLLEVQFWFPVWLIFLLDAGFSLTTAVLADGVFRIVSVACEFPLGILADRLGRRRTYLAMTALTVVVFLAITQVHSTPMLFVAWILWGVQWALTSGTASSYVYELAHAEVPHVPVSKVFGLMRAAGSVAVVLSLLSAGYLYQVDPRVPFAVTAGLAFVALPLAFTLPEIAGSRIRSTLRSTAADIAGAFERRGVRLAVALGVLFLALGWSVRILFQPLALDLGYGSERTGWMYAAFAAAAAVGSAVAGTVTVPRRRPALTGAFVLVLAAMIATAMWAPWGPFVFLPVLSFGYALGWTVLEVFTNEVSPRRVRATILSAVSCLGGIGIAVSRPALGMVADRWTTVTALWVWSVVGVLVVAVACVLIPRVRRVSTVGASLPPRPVEEP